MDREYTKKFLDNYTEKSSGVLEIPKRDNEGNILNETEPHPRDIEVRQDFLFMLHSTTLSPQRADRPGKPLSSGAPQKDDSGSSGVQQKDETKTCIFCPGQIEKVTPIPRRYHDRLVTFEVSGRNGKTITVPNLYPFAKPHWVTVFSTHKPDLSKLDYSDMINYFESGYEILKDIEKEKGISGFWDIINWGTLAGASQVHPHAQRGGILEKKIMLQDKEVEAYLGAYKRLQTSDPFDEYMKIIRESDLFGWENELLFIHAPFAPKMSDQIDIILKPKIHSLSELCDSDRNMTARCMLGVFHLLYGKRNVKQLNVITHQQRFSSRENTYRIHLHVLPRDKSLWGGMEMSGDYIVDVFPETTAAEIRKHYKT